MNNNYQSEYFIYSTTKAVKCNFRNHLVTFTDKHNSVKTIDNIDTLPQFYGLVKSVANGMSGFIVKNDSANFF